jgi:hypothetical protein
VSSCSITDSNHSDELLAQDPGCLPLWDNPAGEATLRDDQTSSGTMLPASWMPLRTRTAARRLPPSRKNPTKAMIADR